MSVLFHVIWEAMTGVQREFSVVNNGACRYRPGFSGIAAFADPTRPDYAALADISAPGEEFFVDHFLGSVPSGWELMGVTRITKMVYNGARPKPVWCDDVHTLDASHAAMCVELARMTNPGPFELQTLELGHYLGIFDGENLAAMAGERLAIPGFREVSGVATHPRYQGRGFAKRLMLILMEEQLSRGETPFLHVRPGNEVAHGLYLRMGFTDEIETTMGIIRRT